MSAGLVSYPVSAQQLRLWSFWLGKIDGQILLVFGRIFTVILLGLALWFWYGWLKKILGVGVATVSLGLILICPATWVAVLVYPVEIIKLLMVVFIIYFLNKKIKWKWLVSMMVMLLFTINMWANFNKPIIFYKLSTREAGQEVMYRIMSEDGLKEPVKLPLLFRRLAYNKYMFVYKGVMDEVMTFFDLETLFFADIHPAEIKTVQLFFWPEVVLFFYGLMILIREKKYMVINKYFFGLLLVAGVNFVFSSQELFLRFFLVLLPFSLIMATGVVYLFDRYKQGFKWSFLGLLMLPLSVYGAGISYHDMNSRVWHWLDNRPMVYEAIYKGLMTMDLTKYDGVRVTTLIGNSNDYCRFYMGNCNKFEFDSFDLSKEKPHSEVVYAGFLGEFVGPVDDNNFDFGWRAMVDNGLGMKIFSEFDVNDTVAFRYGSKILVGSKK